MTVAAIIIAFLLDQVRSIGSDSAAGALLRRWVRTVTGHVDAGGRQHAWLTWLLAVVAPALVVGAAGWLCTRVAGWFGHLAWSVAVLYFTLGFRQFSHRYTAIRDALAAGDEAQARALLARWQDEDIGPLPRGGAGQEVIARGVITHAVLSAHRCVFGVLFWFCLLTPLGLAPAGAVLYRYAGFVVRYWRHKAKKGELAASPALLSVAELAWRVIDWLPARVTALAFAVVGNFEDAIEAWRGVAPTDGVDGAAREEGDNDAIVLAAAAGALGIRLRGAAADARGGVGLTGSVEAGSGAEPVGSTGPAAASVSDAACASSASAAPATPVAPADAAWAAGDALAASPPQPPDWVPAEAAPELLPGGAADGAAGTAGMAGAGVADATDTSVVLGGVNPDARHFAQVAALLWRSVALWLLMLVLLTLAHVLG